EHYKELIKQWPDSRRVMLPHLGAAHEAPEPGEIFRQPDLAATLRKLVEAERQALRSGKDRRGAIHAAYDRFYKGDIARDLAGAADRGPAVEGLRARAREAHPPGPQRPGHPARGSVSVPGRKEPVPEVSGSLALEDAGAASHRARRIRSHVPLRDDQRRGGG